MIVIYRQMEYIQTKNLGYDRENLIYLPIEGELVKKYDLFKEKAVSASRCLGCFKNAKVTYGHHHHKGGIEWPGKPGD